MRENWGRPVPKDYWHGGQIVEYEFKYYREKAEGNGKIPLWKEGDQFGCPLSPTNRCFDCLTTIDECPNWGSGQTILREKGVPEEKWPNWLKVGNY